MSRFYLRRQSRVCNRNISCFNSMDLRSRSGGSSPELIPGINYFSDIATIPQSLLLIIWSSFMRRISSLRSASRYCLGSRHLLVHSRTATRF